MKMSTIKGDVTHNKDVVEEKAKKNVLPEEEEVGSCYGMDPADEDARRELRILKRSDPELYRKIMNMD